MIIFVTDLEEEALQNATEIKLLGLLRGGPVFNAKAGETAVRIPMGLGKVVKSYIIEDLLEIIENNSYENFSEAQQAQILEDDGDEYNYSDLLD